MKVVFSVLFAITALTLRADRVKVLCEIFREESRLAVIDNASKVEACILHVEDPSKGQDLNQRIFVEGRYADLPERIRTLVIWKLLDDRNYTWDEKPACIPTYNARIRFRSGRRTVEVDFCFSCAQMLVREQGTPIGGGYFDPGSDWIFRALATQFPNDPVIRDLKKKREEAEAARLVMEMAKARDARKRKVDPMSEATPDGATRR